jgi:hypothetical protein
MVLDDDDDDEEIEEIMRRAQAVTDSLRRAREAVMRSSGNGKGSSRSRD